ncbi:acyl carrier protein [Parasphingorhabdus sp.]|uniref:acyl carrier protein n=1 Tax=Parasphingorhabdus sp. TaxID=2709688 RepID=UPI003A93941B
MTREELRTIFIDELTGIAPEIDGSSLDDTANIQESYDLDSMDIFNLLAALHQRLDVDIPDNDAVKLLTVEDALNYLQQRLSDKR